MAQLLEGIRNLSLFKNAYREYRAHATFYSMGTEGSLPMDTVADYSPACDSKAENDTAIPPLPSAIMTCTKYRLFFTGKITTDGIYYQSIVEQIF
jgi:hypothetical protein